MKRSSRLFVGLHLLVCLAKASDGPATSERLAVSVGTHAVVVRRTLSGLRRAGLVVSSSGPGGGWSLARDPSTISLHDIYSALGERLLIAVDVRDPDPNCQISSAISHALGEVLREVDAALDVSLARIKLDAVAARVQGGGHHHRVHIELSQAAPSIPGRHGKPLRTEPGER